MAWRLRAGVRLHPMPFGGAFVLDDARLAARQISSELTQLLAAATTTAMAAAAAGPQPPALAAEVRLGLDDGWLIHQDEKQDEQQDEQQDEKQTERQEGPQEEGNA
jgi:hypothetical protein